MFGLKVTIFWYFSAVVWSVFHMEDKVFKFPLLDSPHNLGNNVITLIFRAWNVVEEPWVRQSKDSSDFYTLDSVLIS